MLGLDCRPVGRLLQKSGEEAQARRVEVVLVAFGIA